MDKFDTKDLDELFSDFDDEKKERKTEVVMEENTSGNTATDVVVEEKTEATETTEAPIGANDAVADLSAEIAQEKADTIQLLKSGTDKLAKISAELNELFVERDDAIKILMLSLVSQTNTLLLGPPGTGKSLLVQELCSRIKNGKYFQWMLNKTSDPSEILGSFSIKQMENDKFKRITTDKLPEAHIAFLDEVYKCNAPVLNTLLTIMNEHIFYNDGNAVDIPLISLIGASNEPPEDDSLNALHDRFIFRMNVQYVKDAANKKKMHNNYIKRRQGAKKLAKTTITIAELEALQEQAKNINVSSATVNSFIRLISELNRNKIKPSDRRQNECFKIMQASAALRGSIEVGPDDFNSLVYVLWNEPEDIPVIESAIQKICNPYDDKFKELQTSYAQIKNKIDSYAGSAEEDQYKLEAKGSLEKILTRVNKLINDANNQGKSVTTYTDFRDEVSEYANKIVQDALGLDIF